MTGRSLAEPAFPDDDGRLDPRLGAVLGDTTAVLSLLGQVRVFVPIVASLGEASRAAGPEALVSGDKDADMAAVLMTGRDGRQALLTFTSLDAMARWNPQARPVPRRRRPARRHRRRPRLGHGELTGVDLWSRCGRSSGEPRPGGWEVDSTRIPGPGGR